MLGTADERLVQPQVDLAVAPGHELLHPARRLLAEADLVADLERERDIADFLELTEEGEEETEE